MKFAKVLLLSLSLTMAATSVDAAKPSSPTTAKEVLVVLNGAKTWVSVPGSVETDALGRIDRIILNGRELSVLATRHKLDGHTIIVDRIAYEGDATPSPAKPAVVSTARKAKRG